MADAFSLPALPYAEDALAPVIGAQTVGLHHGKHHKTYFDKMNPIVAGTAHADMALEDVMVDAFKNGQQALVNNAGQAWNHILYWTQFTPGGANAPTGKLASAIDETFGGFGALKDQFIATGVGVFGSGWAWLVKTADGSLAVTSTPNQDSPLMTGVADVEGTPIIGLDVWEHAYYLKYQNKRPDFIAAFWNVVDWSKADAIYSA